MTGAVWAEEQCRFPQRSFRRIFRPVQRPVPPNAEIVTAYTNGQVTLRSNRRLDGYHEASDLSAFQGVEVGDFVVHGLDILRGSVGVSDSSGAISSVCVVCVPVHQMDLRYFAYAIRAQAFSGLPRALARGVREGGADFRRWDTLAALPVPVPTPRVQQTISDFLDAESARIDALIAKKQRLQALVSEHWRAQVDAVTSRGRKVVVRRVTSLITSGPRGWAERAGLIGEPFIRSANLQRSSLEVRTDNLVYVEGRESSEAQRSRARSGDTVIGITGANTGWVGLLKPVLGEAYVSQHVAILRPTGIEPQWLAYSVFAQRTQEQLLAGQYGGTKQQLGLDDLAQLTIYLPSRGQQQRLCAQLDEAARRNAILSADLTAQIALLHERRQALITAAITGQLDIPGLAA